MHPSTSFGARLHALRLAAGLSQVEVARRIGRHPSAIGPYERDDYVPPRDVVERLAELLGTTPEYLCFGRVPQGAGLALVGVIEAESVRATREAREAVRDLQTARLIGFVLEDDAMLPAYRPGQIVLCLAEAHSDPSRHLGRDALVTLRDERRLLRRLTPGTRRGVVTLAAHNAPSLVDVAVAALHAVVGSLDPVVLGGTRISE